MTRPWGRLDPADYRALPLRAHALLGDVPLHDAWRVALPGDPARRTVPEVRRVAASLHEQGGRGGAVGALFGLRRRLGTLLGWDAAPTPGAAADLLDRIPAALRAQSLVPPGTMDGPFHVAYVLELEALSAIRNATVEAWLVVATRTTAQGGELVWGIHLRAVGWLTRPYMAIIDPFRRWLVYPRLLRDFHAAWIRTDPERPHDDAHPDEMIP